MHMPHPGLVIVGAGQAAAELSLSARQQGYTARIQVFGEEPHLPYQRPPLSKAFLEGAVSREGLALRSSATYEKAAVELRPGTRVVKIDRLAKNVVLADETVVPYDKLALTVGGRPRPLLLRDQPELGRFQNLHYVRTADDIERLRSQFVSGAALVIIGGGYVGLEIAAVASRRGLNVTVLEAAPRVLARVTSPEMSAFYERVHREHLVDVRTLARIEGFVTNASGDAITAVRCERYVLPADLVIAGVGMIPNTELAEAAGLVVDAGIVVDEFARTSDPDIVAAGDCTAQSSALYGRRIRVESVPNAMEQARTAAATICGVPRASTSVPWFWSDQFDLKLQIVGLSSGHDRSIVRGATTREGFAVFYLEQGRLISAELVNRPQEFMVAKRLVAQRVAVDPERLADPSIPLKTLG